MPHMRTIAVFARWPRVGHAKTRLIPALTPDLAHRLHLAMLGDALDAEDGASTHRRTLWWAGAPADREGVPIARSIEVFDQAPGDLGDRLAHAFTTLLGDRDGRVIVIGSDCPWLDAPALDRAFDALERSEVVIGPADDGGFHLIGMGSAAVPILPGFFHGIAWSTERTLEETLARVRERGLRVELMPGAADIDTAADVIECLRRAMRDSSGGAHTRAALVAMGLLPPASGGFQV